MQDLTDLIKYQEHELGLNMKEGSLKKSRSTGKLHSSEVSCLDTDRSLVENQFMNLKVQQDGGSESSETFSYNMNYNG
jgi:hypothetical protein